ncbi:MAG: adenylate/guanylate cyclase domain-containing protein [Actinomycetota bacterium]
MANCASCGRELPDGARFCPFCGHQVVAGASEERRVVTVVFADIVGYTALSEQLDPERVKRLIDGAFERLIADIESFGGRVDKVLGDGILALFGAPVAHEDDADRAIWASIQMHESLAHLVDENDDIDGPLQLRVGINTGEVLFGAVSGTTESTAMGDVVNVASRLQTMAEPGDILLGDDTASLVSDDIIRELVDDLHPEVTVRGRQQQLKVWRVIGRQRRSPGRVGRFGLPFVGRTTQLELMTSIMGMVANGRSAIVSVSGEAGSGKSRLVAEALETFPSRQVVVFAGVCAPFGDTNVWSPIATALFRRLDFDPAVPSATLRRVVRERAVELYDFVADDPAIDRFVEGVLHLLGHPSELDRVPPLQARETLFAMIVEGLRRRSRTGPLVLWIDDLQWADTLLIDLLHRIARSLIDRPVLIVTAQRDDAELDWPPGNDLPITVRMPLEPLERDEAAALVAAAFGDDVDSELAQRLYERSGGNPLFLTELTELARVHPESSDLPGTLRALIAARLDRLSPTQRAIVDNAAVLGTTGPVVALAEFAEEMGQPFTYDEVDALVADGVFEVSLGWWRFRSDVVREVAYQTLTKQVRAQRHAGTAAFMLAHESPGIDEIAYHAASAAELVAEIGPVPGVLPTIGEQAAQLLHDAARRSLDVGAFHQAQRQAARALELGIDDPDLHRHVLLVRGEALRERRMAGLARADGDDVLADAIEAGDTATEARARRLLGVLDQRDGDLDAARFQLGRSVELFRQLGDDIETAASLRDRGFAEVFGGSLSDAEWLLGESEALSEQLDDRRGRAWVRQHQAWVAFLSGDSELAEERLTLAREEFADLGDRQGSGWANGLLAYVRFFQRDFAEAERLANEVRATAVELGDRWAPSMMDSLIASIRLWTGRFSDAEELSRRATVGFEELGDRFGMVQALAPRLRALVALGRTHEAERTLEEMMTFGESFGNLSYPWMAAAGASVHMGLGERAVTVGEESLARVLAMGAEGSENRVTLALARCQIGEPDIALAILLDVGNAFPYAQAVQALASSMTGDGRTACELADAVVADRGSSYLDRVIADVAAAGADARDGRVAEAKDRLTRAGQTARRAGDAVARALVAVSSSTWLGTGTATDVEHLGPGWRRVVDDLAAMGARPELVDQPST